MRETKLTCDKFEYMDIQGVTGRKAVNEHASFCVRGHIAKDSDEYVLRSSAGQTVSFTAAGPEGSKILFTGLISGVDIHTENEMRTLSVSVLSHSTLMDLTPETRTFQDVSMTYSAVTKHMEDKNSSFGFLWPTHGGASIGIMMVQYKETDWQYCKRLAGRVGTVVVPDYLLGKPYISIGMPKRALKPGIDAISYTLKKDTSQFRDNQTSGGYSERDAICYVVKSREIFDLCDPLPFMGMSLYVYSIDTTYEGDELIHYYTLKEKSGFFTKKRFNEDLPGASLIGSVKEIQQDQVRVLVNGDIKQSDYKWFPYATPFTQPAGYGWYFMPEAGDEIRLQFPSNQEYDAYVSSAVHIIHGNRSDPKTKYIRTVHGQIIQFDPQQILIDDGAGSSIALQRAQGISMETSKTVTVDAQSDITMSAGGKVNLSGGAGVVLQKNSSVVNVDDAIDISSEHTRVQ